jgi:hypothetical protein
MSSRFMPATRKKAKARIALAGPSGAGKTLTGLKLLYTLTGSVTVADGLQRIAFVDTERDSADKYAVNPELPGVGDMTPEEAGGYGFSKFSPVRYDPRQLVELIDEAALAGFQGFMLDSASHYWFGPGGILELVDLFARNHGGRSMDGWKDVRPIERAYIEALMSFPGHVVVCLRSKQKGGHDHRRAGVVLDVPRPVEAAGTLGADQRALTHVNLHVNWVLLGQIPCSYPAAIVNGGRIDRARLGTPYRGRTPARPRLRSH